MPEVADLPRGDAGLAQRDFLRQFFRIVRLPVFAAGLRGEAFQQFAVLFGIEALGNAIFAAVYYSSQRLLKARMLSDKLSNFHFWGWQAIIVAAAVTLPMGITQSKEYAELEWPIDLAIAVVWVAFGVNFFGMIARRRERHIYVAV